MTTPEDTPKQKKELPKSYPALLGFARREVTSRGTLKLKLNFGRIAVFMGAMAVLLWMGKSVALYYFFKNVRNFEVITFSETFMFPFNRAAIRIAQGDYQVEQAQAAIEREDYRRAFMLLREGVTRSPGNMEGRELLAQIYVGWRPDLAVDLMIEGMELGDLSDDYLRLMLSLLLQEREDERLLELTDQLMNDPKFASVSPSVVRAFRLQSALLRGRFEILESAYEGLEAAERSLDDVLIAAQYYRKIGDAPRAVSLLAAVLNAQGQEPSPQIYEQLIDTLKEGEELARAREVALEYSIRNPLEWRPRMKLIDLLSASNMEARRDREIRSLLQEHRNDEQAMTALAEVAASYGNVWAASRLYELALENGFNLGVFSLTLAEAMIEAGEFQQAIELCNELAQEDPTWLINAQSSFNAIRSLAYFGAGNMDLGQLYLNNFVSSRGSSVQQMFQAAQSFRDNGFPEMSMRILEEAHARDNRNERVLAKLVEVEMEVGAFFSVAEHLNLLFELRRPDYELLEQVHEQLQGDRFLYTQGRSELLAQLTLLLAETDPIDLGFWGNPEPSGG
jgi:tetratricopeptide (TPR) repeat protein